jgi:release factor glutamine methyltransferase
MTDCLEEIRQIIKEGEFENADRDFAIASFHLKSAKLKKREINKIIKELKENIPISRIIGYTIFCGCKIFINKHVLHPGPETVLVAEKAIKYIRSTQNIQNILNVCDLCTGSGGIAIAIAKHTSAIVTATDISKLALTIAKKSAVHNNVEISFLEGDMFTPIHQNFDLIISNPPYVDTKNIYKLPPFIIDYSPSISLDGKDNGVYYLKQIIENGGIYLNECGRIFIEYDHSQDKILYDLSLKNGWDIVEKYKNVNEKICGCYLKKNT